MHTVARNVRSLFARVNTRLFIRSCLIRDIWGYARLVVMTRILIHTFTLIVMTTITRTPAQLKNSAENQKVKPDIS